jgi:hypothetical protein
MIHRSAALSRFIGALLLICTSRCEAHCQGLCVIGAKTDGRFYTAESTLEEPGGWVVCFNGGGATATLAVVELSWWMCAEALLLLICAHLQVGVNGSHEAEPEVRLLAVAECASPTFCRVVGRFPPRVVEECAQSTEMIHVEMLLLRRSGVSFAASASVRQI